MVSLRLLPPKKIHGLTPTRTLILSRHTSVPPTRPGSVKKSLSDRPVPHRGLCEDPPATPVGPDNRDFRVRIVRDAHRQFRCPRNKRSPLVEFCGNGKPVIAGIVPDAYLHAVFRVCPRYDPLAINPEGFGHWNWPTLRCFVLDIAAPGVHVPATSPSSSAITQASS